MATALALAVLASAAQSPGSAPRVQPVPAAAEARPAWSALNDAQRQALAPLKDEWPGIDAARKEKWLDVAARMPGMAPQERQRVQQRMAEWARLTPAERGRARQQFQEVQRMAPAPGNRQESWQAYQALPADQRQALAAKAIQPNRKPTAKQATGSAKSNAPASPEVKRNVVGLPAPALSPRPVAPTVVQARPGATTSLVTARPTPPAHHQAGLPKVNAGAGFVDPATLLPRRGPQGAAALTAMPAASAPLRP